MLFGQTNTKVGREDKFKYGLVRQIQKWEEKTNTNVVWSDKYKSRMGRQILMWFGRTNTKAG